MRVTCSGRVEVTALTMLDVRLPEPYLAAFFGFTYTREKRVTVPTGDTKTGIMRCKN